MPYQGVAFAFLLGIGIATAALCYFIGESVNRQRQQHQYNYEPPPETPEIGYDTPPNGWTTSRSNSKRRRGRGQPGETCEECTICFQVVTSNINQTITLPCKHKFHRPCIRKWIEVRGSSAPCPNCRERICGI